MAKIENDKYYTPTEIALKCINKANEVIGIKNITEYVEPSAGNGSFSLQIPNCISYDIEPEHPSILKQNYLLSDLSYKFGRLVIGNPPFGSKMHDAQLFFKKSIQISDYIAFILPISQLWNTNSLYEFDLIHSEDLNKIKYSNVLLHCCFNIYERPTFGLNEKPDNKLKSIKIIRQDAKDYNNIKDYDIRMCYWGNGSAGKILKDDDKYSGEYKIIVNDEYREQVKEVLNTVNWWDELNCVAMLKIQQFHIVKILKKYIKNIY